jgi:DNA-binding transcriptional LysR family regulator
LEDHACLRIANPSTTPQWTMTDGKKVFEFDPTGPLVGDNPEVIQQGACSGLGIAMLPIFSVIDKLRSGALAIVLPSWRSPEIGVYVLMPSRRFVEAKTRAWLELLRSELPIALARDDHERPRAKRTQRRLD